MQTPKAILCGLTVLLLATSPVAAAPPRNAEEQALAGLSLAWMQAIEKKDRKSLEGFLADDYVLQMPGDAPSEFTRRDEWIKNAVGMDWSDFRYENLVANVHGDHATVTSRLHFNVAPYPFAFESGVVDLWEKRDGRWQVTARYLGESKTQQRIAFVFGLIAGGIIAALAYLSARLFKRAGRRAA